MYTIIFVFFACQLGHVQGEELRPRPADYANWFRSHNPFNRTGNITVPFQHFLLQQPPFEVETDAEKTSRILPAIHSVPLVMRILFEGAQRVSNREVLPQGGDFHSLARSIRPTDIEELGLQRVILDFPPLESEDMKNGTEAWLVFQLRQSHILGYNCSQVLTVYEEEKSPMKKVATVPLNYMTNEPLLIVNITGTLCQRKKRPSRYVITIKDRTSYTRDEYLYSFANYIDCSLTRACEVLELHDQQFSPVLLILSHELAVTNLLESQTRFRRQADYTTEPIEVSKKEHRVGKHKGGMEQKNCRLVEWNVNVEQLGWDWLIFPERIPLNLCVGNCPILLDRHFNATSHAVARGLYRLVLGQEAKRQNTPPCCVPVKYLQFTMLIEKLPGIISLETSSDLSAAQCGCR